MHTKKICPGCNSGKLSKKEICEEFKYKSKKYTIANYIVFACDQCGEKFVDPETSRKHEQYLTDFRGKLTVY